MIHDTKKILVILGPTSSGKSDIAIKLAKKFHGEIISADSRQIFRGMDIGTGKTPGKFVAVRPYSSLAARSDRCKVFISSSIPHHMIDIVSPRTDYNVAKFKKQAEKTIEDILRRGKLPIVCGGTGFWIQAIVNNINFPEVKPNWKLRKKLEKYSAERLFTMLKKMDPERAKTIDAKNKIRLIRAIEICKKIKTVPIQKNTQYSIPNTRYKFLQIGLNLPKDKLYKHIEKRVKVRFKQGMVAEVRRLHREGLSWKKIQSFGLAYLWIPLYLQKAKQKLGFEEFPNEQSGKGKAELWKKILALEKNMLIEKVIRAEKNYAKRQMTWFKRDKRIKWLNDYQQIQKMCKKFLV